MTIATRIQHAARECGYPTQADLARSAGLSPEAMWHLWHGTHEPALRTARRLARALGVTVHYLYHGNGQPGELRIEASHVTLST